MIDIFNKKIEFIDNYCELLATSQEGNQEQTNQAFSEKWSNSQENTEVWQNQQKEWYLKLYGFDSEEDLKSYLQSKKVILDAGCGLGYKAAWFAKLAPQSLVLGMDFSEAAKISAEKYRDIGNLYFLRGDIADTQLKDESVDYISCDQVIHHTENPPLTFAHLSKKLKRGGEFACYVYAKKALPRELLDEHFRTLSKKLNHDQIWELSRQLTELGKNLSDLEVKVKSPEIPLLGIKGGEYDVQRFLYWNFLKCFWNEEFGEEASTMINFDWYSPSNAFRYSEEEYKKIISDNHLSITSFHAEEACYSGRFKK